MNPYELMTLRLLHICTGVFWAGASIYLAAFIAPAAKALGKDGGRFFQQLARTNKLPIWMNIISTINILTGFRLIMIRSNNFEGWWFTGHEGACFTLGGLLALGAYMIGLMSTRPAAVRLAQIGEAVAKQGGVPTPEQIAEAEQKSAKMAKTVKVVAFHLAATVILMAVARTM